MVLIPPGERFSAVAIAASAGGLQAIRFMLSELPSYLPAPLLIAHHRSTNPPDLRAQILGRSTALRVKEAEEGERLRPGTAFIGPAGRQFLIGSDGTLSVSRSDRVDFVRPSADLLFASVAKWFGPEAIAVVLSGVGRDGARGVQTIRDRGGFVIAQDEATSEYFDMPNSAVETRKVDLVLPLHQIPYALYTLLTLNN